MRQARRDAELADMLGQIDVLVDGPFQLVHRTLTLSWRGSSNQRVIDMPATLRGGRAVEWADRAGNLR